MNDRLLDFVRNQFRITVPAWQERVMHPDLTFDDVRDALAEITRERDKIPVTHVAVRGDHPALETIEAIRRESGGKLIVHVLPVNVGPEPPAVWIFDAAYTQKLVDEVVKNMRPPNVVEVGHDWYRANRPPRGPSPVKVVLDEVWEDDEGTVNALGTLPRDWRGGQGVESWAEKHLREYLDARDEEHRRRGFRLIEGI